MNIVQKACETLGKANLPVYTVVLVAMFKGILRPTFTMMDKKQEPATKKYAAVREGLTELIAVPTYIGMSLLTQKLAPAFSPKGKNFAQLAGNAKSTLGFLGVAIAALYAIPKLCNVAMPYMMRALGLDSKKAHPVIKPTSTGLNPQNPQNPISTINPINPINVAANNPLTHKRHALMRQPIKASSPFAKVSTNTGGGLKI